MKDADFICPDTTNRPVLLENDIDIRQTPQDICGKYANLIKRHYTAQKNCETDDQRDKAYIRAGISLEDRNLVAGLLQGLRKHGYYILGIDGNGRLELGVITDSMHEHMQNLDPVVPLKKAMITAFIQKIGRGIFKEVPKVTKADIEHERNKF